MIISEKQIMQLMSLMDAYLHHLCHIKRNETQEIHKQVIDELHREIVNQQSEELKEIE